MTADNVNEIKYITPSPTNPNFFAQTGLIPKHLMLGHSPKSDIMHVKHDVLNNSYTLFFKNLRYFPHILPHILVTKPVHLLNSNTVELISQIAEIFMVS